KNELQRSIIEVFVGTSVIGCITAITFCGYVTIYITIPVLLAFFLIEFGILWKPPWHKWRERVMDITSNSNYLLLVLFLPLLVNCFSVYYELSPDTENDVIYYSQLVEHIRDYGVENINMFKESSISGMSFYHFFEMWITVNFTFLFPNIATVILIKYIVYTFFKVFFVLGIMSLVVDKLTWRSFVIAPLVLLASLSPVDQLLNYSNQTHFGIYTSFWYRPNFLTYNFCFITSFVLHQNNKLGAAIVCLLFLPILSIVTLPGIMGGVILPLLFLLLYKNKFQKNEQRIGGYVLIMSVLLSVIYFAFGRSTGAIQALNVEGSLIELIWDTLCENVKVSLFVLYHHSYRILMLSAVIALFLFVGNSLKKWKEVMASMLFFNGIGIFLLVISMPVLDAYQMAFFGYSMLLVLFVVSLVSLVRIENLYVRLLGLAVICLGFITIPGNDSMKFISKGEFFERIDSISASELIEHCMFDKDISGKTIQLLIDNKKHINDVALFVNKIDMQQLEPRYRKVAFAFGNELAYLKPNVRFCSVTPKESIFADENDENKHLYRAAHNWNSEVSFYDQNIKNIEDVAKYIQQKQFDTLVLSSANIELERLLSVEKKIVDENSGRIYLLLKG
ncbi:MAG: hypothetical protein JKY42_02805, partial [Flavobacteriales bacterium]|nr:hypothetical protein [Flavobacteriales bacterium]